MVNFSSIRVCESDDSSLNSDDLECGSSAANCRHHKRNLTSSNWKTNFQGSQKHTTSTLTEDREDIGLEFSSGSSTEKGTGNNPSVCYLCLQEEKFRVQNKLLTQEVKKLKNDKLELFQQNKVCNDHWLSYIPDPDTLIPNFPINRNRVTRHHHGRT